jgi:hypothetical protein
MRFTRLAACSILLAPAAAPPARADSELQGLITGTTGFTDNVLGAPEQPADPDVLPPEFDAFVGVSPGLLFSMSGPRAVHRLSYLFEYTAYLNHDEANYYSNRVGWSFSYATTPRSEVITEIGVTQGKISSFDTRLPAGGDLNPGTGVPEEFVSAAIGEEFNYELTKVWLLRQTAGVSGMRPTADERARTLDAGLSLAGERAWRYDAASIGLRLGYTATLQPPAELMPPPDQHQLLAGVESRWRHDIGGFWTSELRLGLIELANLRDLGQNNGPLLSGGAILSHITPDRTLGVGYNRDARASLFVGGTVQVDEVSLFAVMPVKWLRDQLRLNAVVAYQYSRGVSFDDSAGAAPTHLVRGEAFLSYELSEALTMALRYDYTNQQTEGDDPLLADFDRHNLTFTFGATYPSRPAGDLPWRRPLRVNRADQTPSWDEDDEDEDAEEEREEPGEDGGE